ncbi:hypothetical protein HYPSUDRAFT_209749 [Hypholoma sublateritium FD-334 SS-4]|uniref:Uncharacterized protein n=1 Tax=Hypholoma sublateritium (strain FD-334 SS-4) TaxID=945553 RepID=A0A0D2KFN1_HYPSF|nr:hypothetical protein HYPSUDRAFT_209749 [Hypholoma sublateritium FD-334 SS-4]
MSSCLIRAKDIFYAPGTCKATSRGPREPAHTSRPLEVPASRPQRALQADPQRSLRADLQRSMRTNLGKVGSSCTITSAPGTCACRAACMRMSASSPLCTLPSRAPATLDTATAPSIPPPFPRPAAVSSTPRLPLRRHSLDAPARLDTAVPHLSPALETMTHDAGWRS